MLFIYSFMHSLSNVAYPDDGEEELWTLAPAREIVTETSSTWTMKEVCGPCGTLVRIDLELENKAPINLWQILFLSYDRFVSLSHPLTNPHIVVHTHIS